MNTKNAGLLIAGLGVALTLTACEEKKGNKLVLGAPASGDCTLSLDTLDGTTWVMEKVNPDKSVEPDIATRLRFFNEGGQLKANYNVGSVSDMYTYECTRKETELDCRESPKLKDWCQSLAVAEGSECTAEKLKEWAPNASDADIEAAMKAASETVATYKDKPEWKQFAFNNNNLGNKLQGLLYVRVYERKCNLQITDMYMTIYNGKRVEDSNPVGTNAFVKHTEELSWEHCTDAGDLFARKDAAFPEKEEDIQACYPNRGCSFSATEPVHYYYLGADGREAKPGCTYSYDLALNGKPLSKDNAAEVVDYKGKPEVRWHYQHTYTAPGQQVLLMTRYATCDGKKEKVETSCNLLLSQ